MLFSHITKWGRKVKTPSVELVKLQKNIRESVHFSNRVCTSLHSLVKEKQRNIRNSRIWQDRLKENQVLSCSHLTQWAAFSVAMNELLLVKLVKVQNSHSSHMLLWKFTWEVQPSSISLLPHHGKQGQNTQCIYTYLPIYILKWTEQTAVQQNKPYPNVLLHFPRGEPWHLWLFYLFNFLFF